MKPLLWAIVVLGALGVSGPVSASCRLLGTQLDCSVGERELVIGTQAGADSEVLPVSPLQGSNRLFDTHAALGSPLRLELQNVGTDPSLCWRFGDETYCH